MFVRIKEPKDGRAQKQNLTSQPLSHQKIFNNPNVITEGWYPICQSKDIKPGTAKSFEIFKQRIVVFRTKTGKLSALDAFCAHLGADLGNGKVVGENIQCYFHRWSYSTDGKLSEIPCLKKATNLLPNLKTLSYPISEKYGHIWVFSAENATHKVPTPSGLKDNECVALYIKEITLFVHHHVMMANGIDLQHFSSVHGLDIEFEYTTQETEPSVFEWQLSGRIPTNNLKGKLARFIFGETFSYKVKFFGGSVVAVSYGTNQKFLGFKLPSLQILWGCTPQENGVSRAKIFFITNKRPGLLGNIKNYILYFFTGLLIIMLRDEDISAFPHMRFNPKMLIAQDESLAKFMQFTNRLQPSIWGDSHVRS